MNQNALRPPQTGGDLSSELEEWIHDALCQHENALLRYANLFVGDLERARDVVQDTFLRLCQQAQTESERNEIQPRLSKWLYKVCRNRAIDVSRKENRMKLARPEHVASTPDVNAEPVEALQQREASEQVARQIERLPVNQQEVLRLKFQGGLSYQEIANVTGLSATNVGFLLHTAIKGLRNG